MQSRGVRRPSVCPSVNFFCANRYFYHKHDWIATKLAHDKTCTRWSSHGPASRMCSRSRSRSKVTWYGHFCDVTKCLLYLLTFCLYMHSRYEAPLHSDQYKCQAARCNVYIMEWATPSLTVWYVFSKQRAHPSSIHQDIKSDCHSVIS